MRRFAIVALFALAGCPRPTVAPGPEETLEQYRRALGRGQLDAAYALMSTEYRRTHDRAAFERAVARRDDARLRGARVERSAEVVLDTGETIPLVDEGGQWRLAGDPLDFYPQRTPEEALRSFARAVDNRRYDVALAFVPERYAGQITVEALRARWEGERRAELLKQLDSVKKRLAEPGPRFEMGPVDGEARLPVGDHKQAKLVREKGAWKIESLE